MNSTTRTLLVLAIAGSLSACFEEPDGANTSTSAADGSSTGSNDATTSPSDSTSSQGTNQGDSTTFVESDSSTTTFGDSTSTTDEPPPPPVCGCPAGALFCDGFEERFSQDTAPDWGRPNGSGPHTAARGACGTALELSIPSAREPADVFTVATRTVPNFNQESTSSITIGGVLRISEDCFEDSPRIAELRIDHRGGFRYAADLFLDGDVLELRQAANPTKGQPKDPLVVDAPQPGAWTRFAITLSEIGEPPGNVTVNVGRSEAAGKMPDVEFGLGSTAIAVLGPFRTVLDKPIACTVTFDDAFVSIQ